jgi:tetratricopeptide (TPR) repeat protein
MGFTKRWDSQEDGKPGSFLFDPIKPSRLRVFLAVFLFTLFASLAACAQPATDRAMALARQHREAEGIAVLRADIAKHPDDLAARRLLVRLLAFSGDMNAARDEVEALAKLLPPRDPTPWIELGHAYELSHKYDEALAAYDEAATIAPESPAGPREGGMRAARWGELDEARPRLEEAIRRGARDGATYHALGLVRLHQKDYDAAEEAYHAGATADPNGAENWLGLATVAVARGDAAKALAAYDAVLARRPRFAAGQLGRAWALAKLGRNDEARDAIDRAEEMGAPRANVAKARAELAEHGK